MVAIHQFITNSRRAIQVEQGSHPLALAVHFAIAYSFATNGEHESTRMRDA
jgi:hypothetical protein